LRRPKLPIKGGSAPEDEEVRSYILSIALYVDGEGWRRSVGRTL